MRREYTLEPDGTVRIADGFCFRREPGVMTWRFLCASQPVVQGPVVVFEPRELPGGESTATGSMRLTGVEAEMTIEAIPLDDRNLVSAWVSVLYRLTVVPSTPLKSGEAVFVWKPGE